MSCVCSGVRTCLLCRPNKLNKQIINDYIDYYYCRDCGDKAFDEEFSDHRLHTNTDDTSLSQHYLPIDGVFVEWDVISVQQERHLINKIDAIPWVDSQSGRRKQDFGPKVNFKKQKLNFNHFSGLPDFDIQLFHELREQLSQDTSLKDDCSLKDGSPLKDFIAVEVCHLDYNSLRGSSIDPHFDDSWLWGPRLLTVNLLSATTLNLILPEEQPPRHRIRVVLPERSLVILSSDSRFKYQHSIDSEDINGRRIAITYRELSPAFLPDGPHYEKWGKPIVDRSLNALTF